MTGSDQPQFTFLLLAYNQERWIGDALAGALAQTFSPLEILINDDGSTDATQQIIHDTVAGYRGPHAVRLNFNENNIGLLPSINRCFRLASAPFIVVAAGDDVSQPDRVAAIAEAISNAKDVHAIVSDATAIDESGSVIGHIDNHAPDAEFAALRFAERGGYLNGAAAGYSRQLIEIFGDLDPAIWAEDSLLPFRAALLGRIMHIPRALVLRRIHPASLSGAVGSREGLLRSMRPAIAAFSARLADIEHNRVHARFNEDDVKRLRSAILRSIERQSALVGLVERRHGGLRSLVDQVKKGNLTLPAALKTLLMFRLGLAWRSYTWASGLLLRLGSNKTKADN